jgi:hypothetical protein
MELPRENKNESGLWGFRWGLYNIREFVQWYPWLSCSLEC